MELVNNLFETKMTVLPEWIDHNGHMNVAYYALLFDMAINAFLETVDLGQAYVAREQKSIFALENHMTYQHELLLGNKVRIFLQLLDVDRKFIHYFMRMEKVGGDDLSATMEQISLNVDVVKRSAARFPEEQYIALKDIQAHHSILDIPREVGRSIQIRRPTSLRPKS